MADVTVDPECNDPKELFGQGVRAFILQDYEAAVSALSKASELLVAEHKDDLHDSLGEVYLYYGKALLGLSREENEALGDAVPKNSAEDSEDDDDEQDEGEGTEPEDSSGNKTEENGKPSSPSAHTAEAKSGGAEKKETETDQPSGSEEKPGPSTGQGDEEATEEQQDGEEDTTDLQVAWEVLELAKKIFEKLDEKKNLAETLIVLGEVSLESENFESAINDITQGLELQKELFAKDSRTIAETLYKLGMAFSTNSQMDKAIESFTQSLDYLRNRIKTLEEIKASTQEHKDEIEEIKGLIPEIEDKIADMHVYKDEVCVCKEIVKCLKHKQLELESEGARARGGEVNRIEVRRAPREETIVAAIDKLSVDQAKNKEGDKNEY